VVIRKAMLEEQGREGCVYTFVVVVGIREVSRRDKSLLRELVHLRCQRIEKRVVRELLVAIQAWEARIKALIGRLI